MKFHTMNLKGELEDQKLFQCEDCGRTVILHDSGRLETIERGNPCVRHTEGNNPYPERSDFHVNVRRVK